ncbi:HNH endonuclease [Microbacterium kunmingense]|uniref:HNH endonuclease n=1 Tax=Microbacterium kunmingense TaxID=2915939 RepID=UPI003D7125AF
MPRPKGSVYDGVACSIDGCPRPARKRGWCLRHYKAWERNGDPVAINDFFLRTPSQRFWGMVAPADANECWLWMGTKTVAGYGMFRRTTAHRFAYEDMIAPIPENLTLDHLCRTRGCVNPYHLDPCPREENARRARAAAAAV